MTEEIKNEAAYILSEMRKFDDWEYHGDNTVLSINQIWIKVKNLLEKMK